MLRQQNIFNFYLACRKECIIFKRNFSIIVCSYRYISCNLNECIRIITKTCFNAFSFKFSSVAYLACIYLLLFDHLWCSTFFVANLDFPWLESFSKFIIFYNQFFMLLTEFYENSKVVSSDFSMMTNIVALSSSCLPITLICCFKSFAFYWNTKKTFSIN